jgi:hypothetical protein
MADQVVPSERCAPPEPVEMHEVAEVQASEVEGLAASLAAPVHAVPFHRARTVGLGGVPEPATDSTVQAVADAQDTVPGSVGTTPPG